MQFDLSKMSKVVKVSCTEDIFTARMYIFFFFFFTPQTVWCDF